MLLVGVCAPKAIAPPIQKTRPSFLMGRAKPKLRTKLSAPSRKVVARSFMSEIALHNLSYADIFLLSSYKNLLLYHLPSLLMYRAMRLSAQQMAYFTLFNIMAKTAVDIWLVSQ